MAQKRFSNLPWPPNRYRVDLLLTEETGRKGFESDEAVRREDLRRAELIRRTISRRYSLSDRTRARQLATELEVAKRRGRAPKTLASARYFRDQRIRVIGAILEFVQRSKR